MAGVKERTKEYVFGLDIGTRSIVGTVGYLSEGKFHVVAQYVVEHETRAMLDGQIHDIQKVAEGIQKVKRHLEKKLNRKLKDVCVAAAGRVLRTVTQRTELCFDAEKDITADDVGELSMKGVRKAYDELYREVGMDSRFYCVGHTVIVSVMLPFSLRVSMICLNTSLDSCMRFSRAPCPQEPPASRIYRKAFWHFSSNGFSKENECVR